jgi:hypothetical protein
LHLCHTSYLDMGDSQKRTYYRPVRNPRQDEILHPPISELAVIAGRTFKHAYPILPGAALPEFRTLTPINAPAACPWVSANTPAAAQTIQPIRSPDVGDLSDTESTDTAPWIRRPIPPQCEDHRTRGLPRKRPLPRTEPIRRQTPRFSSAETTAVQLNSRHGENMAVATTPLMVSAPAATTPIVRKGEAASAGSSGTGMLPIPLPGDRPSGARMPPLPPPRARMPPIPPPRARMPPIPPPLAGTAQCTPTNMALSKNSARAHER